MPQSSVQVLGIRLVIGAYAAELRWSAAPDAAFFLPQIQRLPTPQGPSLAVFLRHKCLGSLACCWSSLFPGSMLIREWNAVRAAKAGSGGHVF
jgi:hypothetical protein